MAAREVAVSAMATANAIDAGDDEEAMAQSLGERLQGEWSLATALAFLAWFVFAPQCIFDDQRSPGARPTGGNGRCSWLAICSCWPMPLLVSLYWTAVAFGLG